MTHAAWLFALGAASAAAAQPTSLEYFEPQDGGCSLIARSLDDGGQKALARLPSPTCGRLNFSRSPADKKRLLITLPEQGRAFDLDAAAGTVAELPRPPRGVARFAGVTPRGDVRVFSEEALPRSAVVAGGVTEGGLMVDGKLVHTVICETCTPHVFFAFERRAGKWREVERIVEDDETDVKPSVFDLKATREVERPSEQQRVAASGMFGGGPAALVALEPRELGLALGWADATVDGHPLAVSYGDELFNRNYSLFAFYVDGGVQVAEGLPAKPLHADYHALGPYLLVDATVDEGAGAVMVYDLRTRQQIFRSSTARAPELIAR